MPILTWIGDVLALVGGLVATTVMTDMTPRAYVIATLEAITAGHFLGGLVKSPFLALAIGLIACGQGLATQGGAAAVGARTTTAVVLAHLLRDRDQRAVHVLLRAAGRLTMPASTPHIIVDDLRIGWGSRVLMEHVSFQVDAGTTFAILGGSGSGKSTLLPVPDRAWSGRRRAASTSTVSESRIATRACRPSACSFSRARSSAR